MADDAATTPESLEADLIRIIERKRLRALVDANFEVALPLHADDFQLVTPTGRTRSREEYMNDVLSGEIAYLVWEPESEIDVHLQGDMAVIRYRAHLEMGIAGNETVFRCWHTDTYEKRGGNWQVVWSQATQIR